MSEGIPCLWMRGGTSKGAVFLARDLPGDRKEWDALLLDLMGSPDARQIDGLGGGNPLTSKVAILSPPSHPDADFDYLFLQVFVGEALVSVAQGCGNILAATGPAAIERGLVRADDGTTELKIHMVNTGELARSIVQTPGGKVSYSGAARIDGVPGSHAAVELWFGSLAGSMTGSLLPTGNSADVIDQVPCTLIDNGMPCVVMGAKEFGLRGHEEPAVLEVDSALKARIEAIRLKAGTMMGLGDVASKGVPKMVLVSQAANGGLLNTRCWIPHNVHQTIGIFAAITVATAALLPGSAAYRLAAKPNTDRFSVEHPGGAAEVMLMQDDAGNVTACGFVRTARKIMDGRVFSNG